jgi:hypothetical protein
MNRRKKCVRDGGHWMDIVKPDWFWRVNPATIKMFNINECVAGQVFDDDARATMEYPNILLGGASGSGYGWAVRRLGGYQQAGAMGFSPLTGSKRLWAKEIRRRRREAARTADLNWWEDEITGGSPCIGESQEQSRVPELLDSH